MQPCKVIRLLLLVCISIASFVHSEPLGHRSAEQTSMHLTSDRLVGNHRFRRDVITTTTNNNKQNNSSSSAFEATADPNAYLKDDSHAGHAAPFASPARKPKHSDDASGDEEEDFNGDDDKPMDDEDDETDPENEDDEEDDLNEDANDNEESDKNGSGGSTSLKDNFDEDTDDETNEKPTSKNDPIGPSHTDFEGSGEGEDDEKEDDDEDDKLDADEDENESPTFANNNNNNNKFNFDTNHGSSSNIKPESTLPNHSLSDNNKKPDHSDGDRTHLYSSESDFNRPKAPQPEEDDDDDDADKTEKDDDKDDEETHKPIVPPKTTVPINSFDNHDHNNNNNNHIDDTRSDPPTWSTRPDWTSETVSPPSRPSDNSNENSILLFGRHNWSNTVSLFAQPTILAVIIVSAVLGLLVSIFLVMCIIYRMISKDEDCYEATKTQIHTTYGRANHKDRYP